jgi:3-oxoacid CoA-transferase subunit A
LYEKGTGAVLKASPPKEVRELDGRRMVLELPIHGDFAFVKAWKGDRHGNLVYRYTARNFSPLCAAAARVTIAEVEELVEPGELDPHLVHTPSIFVRRIFLGQDYEKPIEQRTVRQPPETAGA